MSKTTHLNLARKWRSQQFDQIIGQDLSVRMLKNSLYLEHFFPVYLFSGQRGCGKTTTARVFASAINCSNFEQFKDEPKDAVIPCLDCTSCQAMLAGKHPDFIEMDAASHTGVDNVRNIIDASSLMPLMGHKKIYLIDEAHMLSKAAFNAFLKILEEPPASVLFILATTDPQKIIETVRSRCFQLFFKPIESTILLNHLQEVCQKEGIAYDQEGLELVIKETEGSARDALNMLESVRFSATKIDRQAVFQVLGHVEDERIIALFEGVLAHKADKVLEVLRAIDRTQCSASFLWQQFLQLLHACIWIKHGIKPDDFSAQFAQLKKLLHNTDWVQVHAYLDLCYRNESIFLKTSHQHAFFEMILLQLCVLHKGTNNDSGSGFSSAQHATIAIPVQDCQDEEDFEDDEEEEEEIVDDDMVDFACAWRLCIKEIAALDDPLVTSIFKQSNFKSYDQTTHELQVIFSKRFVFFQDWLDNTKHIWSKVLQMRFDEQVVFIPQFTGPDQEPAAKQPAVVLESMPQRAPTKQKNSYAQYRSFGRTSSLSYTKRQTQEPLLDIRQKEQWTKTHLLLNCFPGTVHEIKEQAKK